MVKQTCALRGRSGYFIGNFSHSFQLEQTKNNKCEYLQLQKKNHMCKKGSLIRLTMESLLTNIIPTWN